MIWEDEMFDPDRNAEREWVRGRTGKGKPRYSYKQGALALAHVVRRSPGEWVAIGSAHRAVVPKTFNKSSRAKVYVEAVISLGD